MGLIKTLIVTLITVLGLQIRIQDRSIENHILAWARSTQVSAFLNKAASGGVDFTQDAVGNLRQMYRSLTSSHEASPAEAKRY